MTLLLLAAATLDVGVEGVGYLRFTHEGRTVYAKSASLRIVEGKLAHESGALVAPTLTVGSIEDLNIEPDGTVRQAGRAIGRLLLADVPGEPSRTTEQGLLVFASRPRLGMPGTNGFGTIQTGVAPLEAKSERISSQLQQPAPRDENVVKVSGDSSVETEQFTLGQIAEAPKSLQSIVLGPTPPLGVPRILNRVFIEGKIRQAGFDPELVRLVVPGQVTVRRAGQTVSHAQFVEAAQAAAGSGSVDTGPVGQPMTVPKGALELVAENVNRSTTEVTVTVAAIIDGQRFNARTLKLKSAAPASTVRAGQTVTVRLKSGSVAVSSKGRVMSVDSRTGQATVRIESTGAVLTGTVTADGAIEVTA